MKSFDIVIVGGGMVGLTAAILLSEQGLKIAVIDTQPPEELNSTNPPELRVSAISRASENVFRHCGVWGNIEAERICSYEHMRVWDADSFADISFDCNEVQQSCLGHIIENSRIRYWLWHKAQSLSDISMIAPTKIATLQLGGQTNVVQLENNDLLTAKLIIGADGARSLVRSKAEFPMTFWDYEQTAIVATVKTQLGHDKTARQVFTPTGPLAFLPLWEDNLCSIVWSQDTEQATHLLGLSDEDFNKALTSTIDNQLGLCEVQSERGHFPLKMQYARRWVNDGVALIGDAAHTIHPLAGQGANLGFLDAAALSQTIIESLKKDKDFSTQQSLRPYERWRKAEATTMIVSMESFKQLFDGENPLKKLVRGLGMSVTNKLPFVKKEIVENAMGIGGELPKCAQRDFA